MTLTAPAFYVPDKFGIVADHDLRILQEPLPAAVAQIDSLMATVPTPRLTADVNTVLHVHH